VRRGQLLSSGTPIGTVIGGLRAQQQAQVLNGFANPFHPVPQAAFATNRAVGADESRSDITGGSARERAI